MAEPDYHGRTHCPGGTDPIPCLAPSILDYVWVVNMAQTVGAGDGTSEGSYSKYCSSGTIQSGTAPFTLVTESTTFGGTAGTIAAYDLTAVRCPAGLYLAHGGWFSFVDPGDSLTPLTGAWFWKVVSKDVTLGWNNEADVIQTPDTWRLTGSLGSGAYPTDPDVIPEHLQGTAPVIVHDTDGGYGLVAVLLVNIDTAQHLYASSSFFLQRMTLGVAGDTDHPTA